MTLADWLSLHPETVLLGALIVALAVALVLGARSRRRFEKAMLRQQRALQNRIQEGEMARQAALDTLSGVLTESARQSEERIRAMGESLQASAAQTQQLSADLRERSLRQEMALQKTLDESLQRLQASNEARLDGIRAAVDEKLQTTLQQRLGESFKQVSDQLERVYKGLGEMQTLAGSVGDLKRVLTNVTVRGAWGEARLEAILRQNLTPAQYLANTSVEPGASERVEFAIRLPGAADEGVLLPVDSKFPQADYERLTEAASRGDAQALEAARAALGKALTVEARRIASKYIRPPYTTDFAILFLPTEGLFAEALALRGLADAIQREQRVILAGPTTFTALVTSLQMGFRTHAVEKRTAEVWQLLGLVRKEFQQFGESLDRTRRRLEQASTELDGAASRTRSINRRLAEVGSLDAPEAESGEDDVS